MLYPPRDNSAITDNWLWLQSDYKVAYGGLKAMDGLKAMFHLTDYRAPACDVHINVDATLTSIWLWGEVIEVVSSNVVWCLQ